MMTVIRVRACCNTWARRLGNLQSISIRCWIAFFFLIGVIAGSMSVQASAPERMHPGETQSGSASWYGAEQGHHTASGERFDPDALTAAHRHLPFGTILLVTNTLNGRSVEVRVNDRGPWVHGRIVDVSSAAADVLQMKQQGTVPVLIEVIKLGPPSRHAHG
jgi:rare lipoprotein A (peptidoglycan hydrolase)